jgi:hypothetical protein
MCERETFGKQLLCKLEIPHMSLEKQGWIARNNLPPAHTNKDGIFIII